MSSRIPSLSSAGIVRVPQLAVPFPFEKQLAKTLHRRGVLILLPYENQRHELKRFQQDELQGGRRGNNRFCHDAESGTRFDVAHDGANEARCVRKTRTDPGAAAASND